MTDRTSPVAIERQGEIALLRLNRPAKRNAVNDAMIEALGAWFAEPPEGSMEVLPNRGRAHLQQVGDVDL